MVKKNKNVPKVSRPPKAMAPAPKKGNKGFDAVVAIAGIDTLTPAVSGVAKITTVDRRHTASDYAALSRAAEVGKPTQSLVGAHTGQQWGPAAPMRVRIIR